jgi:RND family efflux transporter MFP subunit
MNKKIVARAGVGAALFALALTAMAEGALKFTVPENQIKALGIKTTQLQNGAEAVRASFPAQVMVPPNAEQVISSPVAGLITQILVQQNELVKPGAPLLRIASPELGTLQLQLLQANARATLLRQSAQREKQLFDEGIIPERRVQEAQAALSEGEATLKQAKAALRLSGMPVATINEVAASGNPQDGLTLVAEKAGVVTEIEAKNGQRVEAASALLHIAQTGRLWLDIQVPVNESSNWQPGTAVRVQGRNIAGRVLSSSAMVAAGSQTVVLRAELDAQSGGMRPGEFLTVDLPVKTSAGGWDLPLTAVAHDGAEAVVFVRTKGGFEARPVKVTASAGQQVRVQGALSAGDEVAISSVVALKGAWLNAKEAP